MPATKPLLVIPPAEYTPPQGPADEASKDTLLCHAPREGVFLHQSKTPPELEGQLKSYMQQVAMRINSEWNRTMPREAKTAWTRGRIAAVRFAVLADGSIQDTAVTLSSGKAIYDRVAQRAVESQLAFPPLPEGVKGPVAFCMHFGYRQGLSDIDPSLYDHWKKKDSEKHEPTPH
jgi:TonB family protein